METGASFVLVLSVIGACILDEGSAAAAVRATNPGCVADMFSAAGIDTQRAIAYEASCSRAGIPATSVLHFKSFGLLQGASIDSAQDRQAVQSCFGDDPGVVKSSACQNYSSCNSNGVCALTSHRHRLRQYRCQCNAGYYGSKCASDACDNELYSCENGGSCVGLTSHPHFECQCSEGFKGFLCLEQIDHCLSAPCQNGALCESKAANVICRCLPGYRGDYCQETWLITSYFDKLLAKLTSGQEAIITKLNSIEERFGSYKRYSERMTWSGAAAKCTLEGGRLAYIRNNQQLLEVMSLPGFEQRGNPGYWIGGEDQDNDGVWKWTNGEQITFSNWDTSTGEPNNYGGNEKCLDLRGNDGLPGTFNDRTCHHNLGFVCEFRASL